MIEDKLAQVGLILPKAAKPTFAYVPVTLQDGVAYRQRPVAEDRLEK